MLNRTTIGLTVLSLVLTFLTILLVAAGYGQLPALLVHLTALGGVVGAAWYSRHSSQSPGSEPAIERADVPLLGAVILVQLTGLLYMQSFPFHYVQDEFITGYTSYTLPSIIEIEWFAGYPGPGEWIAGFPILYYALQRPFIELFGLSLETIRISTWPYHLISAGMVYLIGKELFRCRPWAVVGAIIFVLLAPNLYMAGYGMHNISSTCFFLAALYGAIRMVRDDGHRWVVLAGIASIMAYLTYTSSYLTLPLIGLFIALTALFQRSWQPFLRFGWVVAIVIVGLAPFLTWALTENNYFIERGDQVNAISVIYGDESLENPTRELIDRIGTNIQSLYTSGIGGVTDYWFGRQSLFDWLTLSLLLVGIGIAVVQGVRQRSALHLTLVATVLATFVFGMLLTVPVGGFHRVSLAFPFVALLLVLPIRLVIDALPIVRERRLLHTGATAVALILIILLNLSSLQTMVREDEEISGLVDSVPITGFIEDQIPSGSEIIVSSFPNYHLERELIVRTGDQYDVRIEQFDTAVEYGDSAVIVLFQPPPEQTHRLEARYGGGTFIEEWDERELRRHLIWVPAEYAGTLR
jgi:hypothetical protein